MIIRAHFHDKKIISIMVLALPQSGKTGAILATVKRYVKVNDIPIENIYIITGLSSTDWKIQTQQRMPDSLKKGFTIEMIGKNLLKTLKENRIV